MEYGFTFNVRTLLQNRVLTPSVFLAVIALTTD